MVTATNNGSLYSLQFENNHIFASERFILEELVKTINRNGYFNSSQIKHIKPGEGVIVDINSGISISFSLNHEIKEPNYFKRKSTSRLIIVKSK